MRRPPRLAAGLWVAALAAACATPPPERRGPAVALHRVLGVQLAPDTVARRAHGLLRLGPALDAELQRVGRWPRTGPLEREQRRLPDLERSAALVGSGMLGMARVRSIDGLPTASSLATGFVEAAATVPFVLGFDRLPLRERSDPPRGTPLEAAPGGTSWWDRFGHRLGF
ncbi:MAG: hypothetical protein JNL12_11325 [Planctomycetes bacterium]|nr:hypothetical protein [Planctomycetota bacterium]